MDLKAVNDNIVDLRKSAWDKKTSDPDNGVYVFTKTVKVPMRNRADCEHDLTWSRYDASNGYRELNAHRAEGFLPVLVNQQLYFPMGAYKNPAGLWQYEDVVLMMRPMILFLQSRKEAVDTSRQAAQQAQGVYDRNLQQDGSQVENPVFEDKRII